MMKLSTVTKGALFMLLIQLVCASSVAKNRTTKWKWCGKRTSCLSAQRLYSNATEEFICDKLRNNLWIKIKCRRFRAGKFGKVKNCSNWCGKFARCFNENETAYWAWRQQCSAMFCQSSLSKKAAFTYDAFSPAMDTFHVHHCRKNKFAVRVSHNCSVVRSDSEPCSPSQDPAGNACSSLCNIRLGQKNVTQCAESAFNTTIQRWVKDKDKIISTMEALEDLFIRFAEEKLNERSPNFIYGSNHFYFRVQRVFKRKVREFLFHGTKGNYMKIPSRNLYHGSVVLGVTYSNIHELFISNHSAKNINKPNKTRWLNTIIMSAVIYPPQEVLLENITLVFESIKAAGENRECVFWDSEENPEGWSDKGCRTTIINSSLTKCVCNHLTHFAVLMCPSLPSKKDDKILTILTLVGMSLSLTGVVITIISYLLLTDRHTPLSHIRVSLATAIGAGHVIFLAGIDAAGNKGGCVAVAALLQYFLMAALCWMLVEGIYLYLFVVKVYNIVHADKIRVYQAISWGLPAVIVALSLGIAAGKDGIQSFVNDNYCWISSANNLIWIFNAFVGLIELLNTFILIRVIKEMMTMQHAKENQSEQIRLGIKAFVVLVPLLGVTWLFGFLSPLHVAFTYIFVILNSTQGFSIFIFHCLRNNEIRERFKRRFERVMPHSENRATRTGETCDVSCGNDL